MELSITFSLYHVPSILLNTVSTFTDICREGTDLDKNK